MKVEEDCRQGLPMAGDMAEHLEPEVDSAEVEDTPPMVQDREDQDQEVLARPEVDHLAGRLVRHRHRVLAEDRTLLACFPAKHLGLPCRPS